MQTTVSKWGNSLAVRLPRHIADEMKLVDGSTVTVEVDDGSIRVTPSRKKFKLSELLAGHDKAAEIDWGGAKGEEAW